jgi:hypothetical protein
VSSRCHQAILVKKSRRRIGQKEGRMEQKVVRTLSDKVEHIVGTISSNISAKTRNTIPPTYVHRRKHLVSNKSLG